MKHTPSRFLGPRTLLLALALSSGLAAGESLPSAQPTRSAPVVPTVDDCTACHAFEPELTHPMAVPVFTRLPLAAGGRMDCKTCHTTPAGLKAHLAGKSPARLRQPAQALCAGCHTTRGAERSNLSHGLMLGKAHLNTDAAFGERLDPETRACLGCHDGSVAGFPSVTDGANRGAGRSLGFLSGMSSEHPIAVAQDRLRNGNPSFVYSGQIDPAIRLFAGRVGCGSCHSVYGGQEQQLAIANRKSALCLGCHIK